MTIYKEICKRCGHDKDTHFEKKYSCLASRCDCARYCDVDPNASTAPPPPDTVKTRAAGAKPHANTTCTCNACREWEFKKLQDAWLGH